MCTPNELFDVPDGTTDTILSDVCTCPGSFTDEEDV